MLEISKLTTGYRNDYAIIDGVNLNVNTGEKIGITGRNGVGKSTFVKSIMQLTPYYSGSIIFNKIDLTKNKIHKYNSFGISYFIQDGQVFPNLSVKENLELSGYGSKKSNLDITIEDYSIYFKIFKQSGFLNQKAGNLSGGERIILALAMIMNNNPKLLILDEPTAGLSPSNVNLVSQFLEDYLVRSNSSLILIDQNIDYMKNLCDRIYLMKNKNLTLHK